MTFGPSWFSSALPGKNGLRRRPVETLGGGGFLGGVNDSIPSRQAEIVARLRVIPAAQEKLSALVARARRLPAPSADERADIHLVPGCRSRVWLLGGARPDGTMELRVAADSAIMLGLAGLLVEIAQGVPAAELRAWPDEPTVWRELGLDAHLSPTRLHGLGQVWRRLRGIAEGQLPIDD